MVLPRALRKAAGLVAGSKLTLSLEADGSIRATCQRSNLDAFFSALQDTPTQAPANLDVAIQEVVQELDDAARRR